MRYRFALSFLLFASCSSDRQSDVLVSEEIGAQGGTIAAPNGALVSVPSGALLEPTIITIERIDPPPVAGAALVGDAFLLGPEGQVFAQRVQVELPFSGSSDRVVVLTGPRGSSSYSLLTAEIDGTIARALTTHFSWFAPGVIGSNGSMDASVEEDAAVEDATELDAGENDAGQDQTDASENANDASANDAGTTDASAADAGTVDAGTVDASVNDASTNPDAGCAFAGDLCIADADCCNSSCVQGICTTQTMCVSDGAACTGDADCCSNNCAQGSCAPADGDGDGYTVDVDCDDTDPAVHPNASESCNGIDDDCDSGVDETCCAAGQTLCNGICTNLSFDPDNCMMCGLACASNEICVNGQCQLPGT